MRRCLLFLFSLLLAPLAMHADPAFQANGYGTLNCGQAAPRDGFGVDIMINIWGTDDHGNFMSADIDGGPIAGQPPCTLTFPSFSVSSQNFSRLTGPGGVINYDGLTYNTGFQGCSSPVSTIRCNVTFMASSSGEEGSLDVALSTWGLTFDSHGDIIYETPTTTVDIGGAVNWTSLELTQELAYPGNDPNLYVPSLRGEFTLGGVPEPAAWGLMTCAMPLLFLYMRRRLIANR